MFFKSRKSILQNVASSLTWSLSVLYCTLLAQAQSDSEKSQIEEKMANDSELVKILIALQETDKEDIVQEERARRQAARQSRVDADIEATDVDVGGVSLFALFYTYGVVS